MKKIKDTNEKEKILNSIKANKYLSDKFPNLKESSDKEIEILNKRLKEL